MEDKNTRVLNKNKPVIHQSTKLTRSNLKNFAKTDSDIENDLLGIEKDVDELSHKLNSSCELIEPTEKTETSNVVNSSIGNAKIMDLLKDIKRNQLTKGDFKSFVGETNTKFKKVETELVLQKTQMTEFDTRLSSMESKILESNYEKELNKQSQLKTNISIIGVPCIENENVIAIARNVLRAFGCESIFDSILSVYRTKGRSKYFTPIIIKFKDFASKLTALNAKKDVKLVNIPSFESADPEVKIYLNTHVTPYFGKILASGRQAIRDGLIHSFWLGSNGCLMKISESDEPISIQTCNELLDRTKHLSKSTSLKRSVKDLSSPTEIQAKKPHKQKK